MGYPKHMYKGFHAPEAITADERIVEDEAQETDARSKGFIDGKEFFSRPSQLPETDNVYQRAAMKAKK